MILFCCGAYGRKATSEDWLAGKDFKVIPGGPYFSLRDRKLLKKDGYKTVHFMADGIVLFTVEL
jgi:hypothetical protein